MLEGELNAHFQLPVNNKPEIGNSVKIIAGRMTIVNAVAEGSAIYNPFNPYQSGIRSAYPKSVFSFVGILNQ